MKPFDTIEDFFESCEWAFDFDAKRTGIIPFQLRTVFDEINKELVGCYEERTDEFVISAGAIIKYVNGYEKPDFFLFEQIFEKIYRVPCQCYFNAYSKIN
jgi:hypothetical protein